MSAAAGLVADIGGTNARLAWVAPGRPGLQDEAWVPVAEHATLLQAVQHYLGSLQQRQGPGYRPPRSACLAVATAVTGDEIAFTNSGWRFSQQALKQALGLESLVVLNDFEALALALPHLGASHLRLHGPALRRDAPLAVVGPGTGLGVACTLPVAGGWVALPGEGGHATLAPHDAFEDAVLAQARRHHAHVSAERLLSGIGLPLLHEAVAAADGRPIRAMSTPEIIREGLAGDTGCRRTLDTFCAMLGGFAGNVALTTGARGGVLIGGGLVPRLGSLFFESAFRERFVAKGRLQSYLQAIPTGVITDPSAALVGAATRL